MKLRFKPCPICGNELDADHNLYYYDSQREWLSNIVNIQNYDDMMDPVNIRDERIWNGLSMIERMCYEAEYEAAVGFVEFLVLKCPCGFSFEADAHAVHFPEYHWLDEMKELANRRWTGDDNEAGSERGLQMDAQVPQVREQADMELLMQLRGCAVSGEDEVPGVRMDPRGSVQDAQAGEEGVEQIGEIIQEVRTMSDNVDHPDHYGGKGNVYEAIKVIEAWDLDFHLGNRWYLDRAIEQRVNTMPSETSLEALRSAFGHEEDMEDDE